MHFTILSTTFSLLVIKIYPDELTSYRISSPFKEELVLWVSVISVISVISYFFNLIDKGVDQGYFFCSNGSLF